MKIGRFGRAGRRRTAGGRVARRVLLAAGLILLLAGWGESVPQARREAASFVLEKLRLQHGDAWDHVLSEFLWVYQFDRGDCELTVRRVSSYGDNFIQTIPVSEALPYWKHDAYLTFYCQDSTDCIGQQVESPNVDNDEKRVGQAKLMAPNSNDLPKLADAFTELHRLCDDAYRPADPETAPPGTPVHPLPGRASSSNLSRR